MRRAVFLVLLLFLTTPVSEARNYDFLNCTDNNIERLIVDIEAILASPEESKTNGCNPIELNVYSKSLSNVSAKLAFIVNDVDSALSALDKGSENSIYEKLVKIKEVLNCVKNKKVDIAELHCNQDCEKHSNMMSVQVEETSLLGVVLSKSVDNKIFICTERMYRLQHINYPSIESSIMHELSHMCGTEDLVYLGGSYTNPSGWALRSREELVDWHVNADHYRYWYLFGFCVPGKNCQSQISKPIEIRSKKIEGMKLLDVEGSALSPNDSNIDR